MDVITYPYWDLSLTMLVKGATGSLEHTLNSLAPGRRSCKFEFSIHIKDKYVVNFL